MRRPLLVLTAFALIAGSGTALGLSRPAVGPAVGGWTGLRAGVGVTDATWHVGASAGQYATDTYPDPTEPEDLPNWRPDTRDEWDPNVEHVKKAASYGVQSRLSIRAIVLQSPGGQPVALVKDDNYLAQDFLTRRVGQILAAHKSTVTFSNILLSATHNHNSPYYSTPAAGVWLFQDVMDLRMFEYQARQMAAAIEQAEHSMRPARMGATTVEVPDYHGNIAGSDVNEDASPTGYPRGENDHGLVVMRFDDMTDAAHPKPLATYANYGQHGESLDGYDIISGDWIASFERYVDRATGAPVVFSQGAVGSSEGPYEGWLPLSMSQLQDGGDSLWKMWAHVGYAQAERGTHFFANSAIAAWQAIGGAPTGVPVQVPWQNNPVVKMATTFFPGPLSHPYPSVGNCRSGPTEGGDTGVPAAGLPDCERQHGYVPTLPLDKALFDQLKAAGAPIPDNYDVPSLGTVEENLRLKLQAARIGDVLLASCACEPQSDLIKALETRTDTVQGNKWNGLDYGDQAHVDDAWPGLGVKACFLAGADYDCPDPRDITGQRRLTVGKDAYAHMRAEVNNPSDGWDDPAYVTQANTEPDDLSAIKGNFTSRELSTACGFTLPVGLGHSSDYNGYTVSYREYMARDSYRKALTSYGAHTADYMVSRLIELAANLKCGTPVPAQPLDTLAAVDEQRQRDEAAVLGRLAAAYYLGWTTQIPDSAGPAAAQAQPRDITRFDAATFTWTGGDNWTDNPRASVQRLVGSTWMPYADQSGEVVVVLDRPAAAWAELTKYRRGTQRWNWIASFEAFDAYPRADVAGGQVPSGTYRFVIDGKIHQSGAVKAYHLTSRAFAVSPWTGLTGMDVRREAGGAVSFVTDPVVYPRSYTSPIAFIHDDGGAQPGASSLLCRTCTFRPWASTGTVVAATVTVLNATGQSVRTVPASLVGGRWVAQTALVAGESAVVAPGGLRDSYGETNASALGPV